MAIPHPAVVSPAVADWLREWRALLTLWLDAGSDGAGASVRWTLAGLLDHPGSAAWPELHALGRQLLEADERLSRAEALLELLVWIESAGWMLDLERLEESGADLPKA